MASYRAVRTSLFKDDDFGSLSHFHRLLWIGLNLSADDQGRLSGNPSLIRAECFPYEDPSLSEISAGLVKLASLGWIIQYTGDGKPLVQIVTWWKEHQTMQWAQPSKYPAPIGWMDRLRYMSNKVLTLENWDIDKSVLPIQVDVPGGQSGRTFQVDSPGGQSGRSSEPEPEPEPDLNLNHDLNHDLNLRPEPAQELDLWQDAAGSEILLAALVADCHILATSTIQPESIETMQAIGVNNKVIQEVLSMEHISNVEIVGHALWAKAESNRPNAGGLFATHIRDRRQYQLPEQYILKRCEKCLRLQCICPPASFAKYMANYDVEEQENEL